MSRCIVILGVHKDTNEAFAELLAFLGIQFNHRTSTSPQEGLPSSRIAAIHKGILNDLNHEYNDLRPLPEKWWQDSKLKARKEELISICSSSFQYLEPHLRERFAEKPKIIETTRRFFRRLGGAPVVVCAYFEPANPGDFTSVQNVAAAIQNLLLAAYREGIGSCWMTGPVEVAAQINGFLGVDDLTLVAVIPMGYPDETPKVPPRRPNRVTYQGF